MPQLDLVNIPYIPAHLIVIFLLVILVYIARLFLFNSYKPFSLSNNLLQGRVFSFITFYLDFVFLNDCRNFLSTDYLVIKNDR